MSVPDSQLNPADLARNVLKYYLEEGRLPELPDPLPPELESRAGAFVSLKKGGRLRGCIGTVRPVKGNLAEEIAANTISTAINDPRFPPVSLEELPDISFSVDVLGPMERIKREDQLDPKEYGIMVRCGLRSGLLLPDLDGIDTVDEQVRIARQKAAISPSEKVELYRFKVTRYGKK